MNFSYICSINKSIMINIQELEELYIQAKEAYYTGEPIMSDEEFDRL